MYPGARPTSLDSHPIADQTKASLHSLESIAVSIDEASPAHGTSLDNVARFRIWRANIGAHHVDKRSIDHRVRDAPDLARRILEIVKEIEEDTNDALAITRGDRPDAAQSEDEDSDGQIDVELSKGSSELEELCLATRDAISSLLKISMWLRRATSRDRYLNAAASKDAPFPSEYDSRHVGDKWPKLRDQPWLQERLGKANVQRRQFLRYARNHHDRLSAELDQVGHGRISNAIEVMPDVLPSAQKLDNSNPRMGSHLSDRPTLAPTDVTTLFIDGTPGSSSFEAQIDRLDDNTSQATTIVTSTFHDDKDGELKVIELSELTKDGAPFQFPFCWSIVQTSRQSTWREHEALLSVSTRPVGEIPASACPFCDDFEQEAQAIAAAEEQSAHSTVVVPVHEFCRHLAYHLEQTALFVIPASLDLSFESRSGPKSHDSLNSGRNSERLRQWQTEAQHEQNDEGVASRSESMETDPLAPGTLGPTYATLEDYIHNAPHDTQRIPVAEVDYAQLPQHTIETVSPLRTWDHSTHRQYTPPPRPGNPRPPSPKSTVSLPLGSFYDRDHLATLFVQLDKDSDGLLSVSEVAELLHRDSPASPSIDVQTLCMLVKTYDIDGTGTIGLDEFCGVWSVLTTQRKVFAEHNAHSTGYMSMPEFAFALTVCGWKVSTRYAQLLFMTHAEYPATVWKSNATALDGAELSLTFRAFVRAWANVKTLTESFKGWDSDGDGYITIGFEEYLTAMLPMVNRIGVTVDDQLSAE